MSVFQVDEYYISITGAVICDVIKKNIEDLLKEEGRTDYEFQLNSCLVVDCIDSKKDADILEQKILNLIN